MFLIFQPSGDSEFGRKIAVPSFSSKHGVPNAENTKNGVSQLVGAYPASALNLLFNYTAFQGIEPRKSLLVPLNHDVTH